VPETTGRRARSGTLHAEPRRVAALVAGLIAFAVAASACGTSELDVQPTFDGVWQIAALDVNGSAVDLTGQALQIEIDTGSAAVGGRTNCRELFGSYTLIDTGSGSGEASFTIPSPAADSSCESADRAVHTSLVEALERVTSWRREGSALTLLAIESQTELVLNLVG
jgi:hypothetical protein